MDFTPQFFARFSLERGAVEGAPVLERRLSDLRDCFADEAAYQATLDREDPVVYRVSSVEPAQGEGQLHYGVGIIFPGRIGAEYYMTKGHLHMWRAAAEVYVGLKGEGVMLFEEEAGARTSLVPLSPETIVYVPGGTAHRTINTGETPLVYIGVYPASAGHDYGIIAERNFENVVVAVEDKPVLLERQEFIAMLQD